MILYELFSVFCQLVSEKCFLINTAKKLPQTLMTSETWPQETGRQEGKGAWVRMRPSHCTLIRLDDSSHEGELHGYHFSKFHSSSSTDPDSLVVRASGM